MSKNDIEYRLLEGVLNKIDNNTPYKGSLLCLYRECLYEKEFQEVQKIHNSAYYKQLSIEEQYKYDSELGQEIMTQRQQYRNMRQPQLSDKELEVWLGTYGTNI